MELMRLLFFMLGSTLRFILLVQSTSRTRTEPSLDSEATLRRVRVRININTLYSGSQFGFSSCFVIFFS